MTSIHPFRFRRPDTTGISPLRHQPIAITAHQTDLSLVWTDPRVLGSPNPEFILFHVKRYEVWEMRYESEDRIQRSGSTRTRFVPSRCVRGETEQTSYLIPDTFYSSSEVSPTRDKTTYRRGGSPSEYEVMPSWAPAASCITLRSAGLIGSSMISPPSSLSCPINCSA